MTTTAPAPGPTVVATKRTHGLGVVLSALMLAMVLASLDSTIVSTALPTIVGDLGGLNHLSWVVTAYLLASTVSTPLYGKLGDQFGRKRLLLIAIVIFLVGSILCGVAQTLTQLIAFRGLQGLGGGGLIVGAQAVMADVLSPRERGRYSGYFGAVFGVTSVAGPLIGGFFVDNASWRWVFYVNVPLGIIALAVIAVVLKPPTEKVSHKIDYLGSAFLTTAITAIVLLTSWGGTTYGWGSSTILGMIVLSVVTIIAFVFVEQRAAEPVIPLYLFRKKVFTVCSGVGFITGFALFGVITYLPQYQQVVRGASAVASGLQLFPVMGGLLLASIGSGQVISRTGRYKVFPVVGTAMLAFGMYLLSHLGVHTSAFVSGTYMFVTGIGLGFTMQVLVLVVQNSVGTKDMGTATSAATFFRSIGGSIGVSVFSAIFNNQMGGNLAHRLPQLAANPKLADQLRASPEALAKLPAGIHNSYLHAFTDSLHVVFIAAIPIGVVAFALSWLIEEVPLRTKIAAVDGVGAGFGMERLAAVQVQQEALARVEAARSALDRIPLLDVPPHEAETLGKTWSARVSYLEKFATSKPDPADVGGEGWQIVRDVMRTERKFLAAADSDGTPGEELSIRVGAAKAALAKLNERDPGANIPALGPLRAAYATKIEKIEDVQAGNVRPETRTLSFWQATASLLEVERQTLVRLGVEHQIDAAVANRADRDLAREEADLAVSSPGLFH